MILFLEFTHRYTGVSPRNVSAVKRVDAPKNLLDNQPNCTKVLPALVQLFTGFRPPTRPPRRPCAREFSRPAKRAFGERREFYLASHDFIEFIRGNAWGSLCRHGWPRIVTTNLCLKLFITRNVMQRPGVGGLPPSFLRCRWLLLLHPRGREELTRKSTICGLSDPRSYLLSQFHMGFGATSALCTPVHVGMIYLQFTSPHQSYMVSRSYPDPVYTKPCYSYKI